MRQLVDEVQRRQPLRLAHTCVEPVAQRCFVVDASCALGTPKTATRGYHIDRSKRTEDWNKVTAQGKRLAAESIWVIMLPEGTRIARGQKCGNRSVAPGHCHWRAHRAHRPQRRLLLATQELPGAARQVEVSIGKLISSAGREPEELTKEVKTRIEAEMRRLDPDAYSVGFA